MTVVWQETPMKARMMNRWLDWWKTNAGAHRRLHLRRRRGTQLPKSQERRSCQVKPPALPVLAGRGDRNENGRNSVMPVGQGIGWLVLIWRYRWNNSIPNSIATSPVLFVPRSKKESLVLWFCSQPIIVIPTNAVCDWPTMFESMATLHVCGVW